jgi:hypothetical protein
MTLFRYIFRVINSLWCIVIIEVDEKLHAKIENGTVCVLGANFNVGKGSGSPVGAIDGCYSCRLETVGELAWPRQYCDSSLTSVVKLAVS